MLFKELETQRLLLCNISSADRNFIYRQFSNDEVNRYLFDAEPINDVHGMDEIIEFYTMPEPRCQHRWILVRKSDNEKVGTCGFHCWDQTNACVDIGYDLFPDFVSKGYMSEAMQAILIFAKDEMKVARINACIYTDNESSRRLAEKFGFVFTGRFKDEVFRGQAYPHMIYSLDFTSCMGTDKTMNGIESTIYIDGIKEEYSVPNETENLTKNLSVVDFAQVDVLGE